MNGMMVYEALSRAAIGAEGTQDMPTTELGWLELLLRNWGLAGLALGAFGFAMYRATQWAGRRFDKYLDNSDRITAAVVEAVPKILETVVETKTDIKDMAKRQARISGVVHRNCGRNEEPDSDTDLGSGSGDIHDDGKHGRKSGERN